MKGRMRRKGHSSSDASDLQVFLFDNYLVFAKIKIYNYLEYYRVYRKVSLDIHFGIAHVHLSSCIANPSRPPIRVSTWQ